MNKNEWIIYKENFKQEAFKNKKSKEYIYFNLNYAENLAKKDLPIIYNPDHLGKLIGIKSSYFFKVTNKTTLFYRKFSIKKRNGKKRIIHEPLPNLKIIQKWILKNILYKLEVSKFAKAYTPNVSIKDNVRFHRNQKYVLKLDIKNFFGSLSEKQVYKIFRNLGYFNDVSVLLTKLCTLNGHLPQGASTSAYLSNLILLDFDKTVSSFCKKRNIRYTRYADDLSFSGSFNHKALLNFINYQLKLLSLELNHSKTRLLKQQQSQIITGIVVNQKIQVSRNYRKKIRLEIYYINKFGLYEHLKHIGAKVEAKAYLRSLYGKICYCLFINPNDLKMEFYKDFIENIIQEFQLKNNESLHF
ncbi:retron St85 family RNA-directed DNA polymerase [Facklamia sp. P12932]|uniref:retron St85 family RNA-directed DNA polymerase n=1 Tax=Facklamia sp. P12932 TaxID=3421947 RepID=UPI003D1829D3